MSIKSVPYKTIKRQFQSSAYAFAIDPPHSVYLDDAISISLEPPSQYIQNKSYAKPKPDPIPVSHWGRLPRKKPTIHSDLNSEEAGLDSSSSSVDNSRDLSDSSFNSILSPIDDKLPRWVHIHIADISHFSEPSSDTDLQARARGATQYFIDSHPNFIYSKELLDNATLSPDRQTTTLTVSALVGSSGEILDYEINPSITRPVVKMTPHQVGDNLNLDLDKFIQDQQQPIFYPDRDSHIQGTWPLIRDQAKLPLINKTDDIDLAFDEQRGHLRLLYHVSQRRRKYRLNRNAQDYGLKDSWDIASHWTKFDENDIPIESPTNLTTSASGGKVCPHMATVDKDIYLRLLTGNLDPRSPLFSFPKTNSRSNLPLKYRSKYPFSNSKTYFSWGLQLKSLYSKNSLYYREDEGEFEQFNCDSDSFDPGSSSTSASSSAFIEHDILKESAGNSMVKELMIIANEIVSDFCIRNSIPIPLETRFFKKATPNFGTVLEAISKKYRFDITLLQLKAELNPTFQRAVSKFQVLGWRSDLAQTLAWYSTLSPRTRLQVYTAITKKLCPLYYTNHFIVHKKTQSNAIASWFSGFEKPAFVRENHALNQFIGVNSYTKFTSPMRRYTDTVVHHQISSFLSRNPIPYPIVFPDVNTLVKPSWERGPSYATNHMQESEHWAELKQTLDPDREERHSDADTLPTIEQEKFIPGVSRAKQILDYEGLAETAMIDNLKGLKDEIESTLGPDGGDSSFIRRLNKDLSLLTSIKENVLVTADDIEQCIFEEEEIDSEGSGFNIRRKTKFRKNKYETNPFGLDDVQIHSALPISGILKPVLTRISQINSLSRIASFEHFVAWMYYLCYSTCNITPELWSEKIGFPKPGTSTNLRDSEDHIDSLWKSIKHEPEFGLLPRHILPFFPLSKNHPNPADKHFPIVMPKYQPEYNFAPYGFWPAFAAKIVSIHREDGVLPVRVPALSTQPKSQQDLTTSTYLSTEFPLESGYDYSDIPVWGAPKYNPTILEDITTNELSAEVQNQIIKEHMEEIYSNPKGFSIDEIMESVESTLNSLKQAEATVDETSNSVPKDDILESYLQNSSTPLESSKRLAGTIYIPALSHTTNLLLAPLTENFLNTLNTEAIHDTTVWVTPGSFSVTGPEMSWHCFPFQNQISPHWDNPWDNLIPGKLDWIFP